MKPAFDTSNIESYSDKKLPLECEFCHEIFYKEKRKIKEALNLKKNKGSYCSLKCCYADRKKQISFSCTQCDRITLTQLYQYNKSINHFCSRSCAVTYNNTHKTKGIRRSKLEIWLEEQLISYYPQLNILFNDKTAINSELDIYIPELKLAFELNGIFHYEPIYGSEKLASIQNNDNRKFQACLEQNIELVIIDSSSMIHFKLIKAQKYLDIITKIIESKCIPEA